FAYVEGTNTLVEFNHLNRAEIFRQVREEANRLQVVNQLEGFSRVIANVETDKKQGSLHLVVLDIPNKEVRIKTFSKTAIDEASKEYLKEEEQIGDSNKKQVVLVSSNSLDNLRKAYPSYFLDTKEFVRILNEITTYYIV